jgi:hypothetical protein
MITWMDKWPIERRIGIQAGSETDRQIDQSTDRHTDSQRQTDR